MLAVGQPAEVFHIAGVLADGSAGKLIALLQLPGGTAFFVCRLQPAPSFDLLRSAIAGIVMSLSLLNRQEEALKYAALYPEPMAGLDARQPRRAAVW